MSKRGKFLVFEGIDRIGKTTQSKLFASKIGNKWICFPNRECKYTGSALSSMLKTITAASKLSEPTMEDQKAKFLLFVANRVLQQTTIEKYLNEGINIVCDRYSWSGIAYGVSQGLSKEWCTTIENSSVTLKPDITILMSLENIETIQNRKDFGKENTETLSLLDQVQKVYNVLATTQLIQHRDSVVWVKVDGLTIEQVETEILKALKYIS